MAVADKNMVSETESGGGMCTNVGSTPVSYAWLTTSRISCRKSKTAKSLPWTDALSPTRSRASIDDWMITVKKNSMTPLNAFCLLPK